MRFPSDFEKENNCSSLMEVNVSSVGHCKTKTVFMRGGKTTVTAVVY